MSSTTEVEQTFNDLVRTAYPTGRSVALPQGPEPDAGRVPSAVLPGELIYVSAPDGPSGSTPSGSGAEVCVAFGNPSNGWCVPSEDTLGGELEIPIPPDICDNIDIGRICHDIRCYETATTNGGQSFTRTSVQPLLAACGGCDEPSCRSLVDSGICECATDSDCFGDESCDGGVCVAEGVLRLGSALFA